MHSVRFQDIATSATRVFPAIGNYISQIAGLTVPSLRALQYIALDRPHLTLIYTTNTYTPPIMPGPIYNPDPAKVTLPDLYVNDGKLEEGSVGLLKSTDPKKTPLKEMRSRLANDGYLFLKGLLPRQDVLDARKNYFQYLERTALLKPGSLPVEGIFDLEKSAADYPGIGTGNEGTGTERSRDFMDLALKAHGEPWYKDDLCKNPVMEAFIAKLTGWETDTLGLQRTLLRNNLPGNAAIGVHYDYIFLRHGEDSVLTSWIPIGDIKLEGGGLIYLEQGKSFACFDVYPHRKYHADKGVVQAINWVGILSASSRSVQQRADSHQKRRKAHSTRT